MLYVSEPVIAIVGGLLQGERSIRHALAHGSFGLGTLSQLDGEVVVLDGVAYHQGPEGRSKRLSGQEVTPFMTMTRFDRTKAHHFDLQPVGDYKQLMDQIKGKFRSENVVYAVLIEGSFPYVQSRAVCKQEGHVRLKTAAEHQVVSEQRDMEGHLVGFWSPPFAGSSINVPGFHFHFLSADKQHGGHVLQVKMEKGRAWLVEIHRVQVDFPFREEYLDSELDPKQASVDLAAAE
jgi:acetolactate decarboxylase